MQIAQLVQAEIGWKAVFAEPEGGESVSRIVAWALGGDGELAGVIVDPADPAQLVLAPEAVAPSGGEFDRYRWSAPAPAAIAVPTPPPPPPQPEESPEQLAKGLLRRKR